MNTDESEFLKKCENNDDNEFNSNSNVEDM